MFKLGLILFFQFFSIEAEVTDLRPFSFPSIGILVP